MTLLICMERLIAKQTLHVITHIFPPLKEPKPVEPFINIRTMCSNTITKSLAGNFLCHSSDISMTRFLELICYLSMWRSHL